MMFKLNILPQIENLQLQKQTIDAVCLNENICSVELSGKLIVLDKLLIQILAKNEKV